MKADLHLHSTASDGLLSPRELVAAAAQAGFDLIAVTDHDSVDGVREAQEQGGSLGVRVLPGVEMSCGATKEIHILGYGFDPDAPSVRAFCDARRASRENRARRSCEQLCAIGKNIDYARVRALAGGVVGRPHIARALLEAGHVTSVQDAFDRYLTRGKPGFVQKEEVRVAEAVSAIRAAGGVAVLAHPMELKVGEAALCSLLEEWRAQGLEGVEVFHPSAQNNHAAALERLARRMGLLVTGGSDFHGATMRNATIGDGIERWKSADEDVSALLSRLSLTR